jgi:ABC-type antimicrobial peptide transport system permease subunit
MLRSTLSAIAYVFCGSVLGLAFGAIVAGIWASTLYPNEYAEAEKEVNRLEKERQKQLVAQTQKRRDELKADPKKVKTLVKEIVTGDFDDFGKSLTTLWTPMFVLLLRVIAGAILGFVGGGCLALVSLFCFSTRQQGNQRTPNSD